ncbi:TetR/AcrR family transcriptional regulator [Streptomyces sp. NBC_01190]|uniref:TetR/AcrR family transcriptional regulator n=1 Tax=Streptomyces sp. NBC_01190 TaxID=2903767 RepID=UPI00386B7F83|nr:TetR/AcrR family transcriptional regulator [Streptomyces sp. NBC_01190]
MDAIRTARARARAELIREIKESARGQLAVHGATGLSLRAVARELGMASSAVYRYFPSRDDLLTALLVDGFDALGGCAERAAAGAPGGAPADRWVAVWTAVRGWAVEHPQEYALLYGSPVPDYAAPPDTVAPAARVGLVLTELVREAELRGTLRPVERSGGTAGGVAGGSARGGVTETAAAGLPGWAAARLVECWAQLFGLISFELFGHFNQVVEDPAAFFAQTVRETGTWLSEAGSARR